MVYRFLEKPFDLGKKTSSKGKNHKWYFKPNLQAKTTMLALKYHLIFQKTIFFQNFLECEGHPMIQFK
jgi:hypothetical protein